MARQSEPDALGDREISLSVPAQDELRLLLEILEAWHRRATMIRRWALPFRPEAVAPYTTPHHREHRLLRQPPEEAPALPTGVSEKSLTLYSYSGCLCP